MKGDFSRNTFNQLHHFSRVLEQQGRVHLDADWNEQAAILLHYLQTLTADIIGPFGGPGADCGFGLAASGLDFTIGQGHYYVDGLLCENDQDKSTYFNQADFPQKGNKLLTGIYLAYLDVWEHHITALEEGSIREVALGGPDTATRAKLVWQLKVMHKLPKGGGDIPPGIKRDDLIKNHWVDWVAEWKTQADGQLKVRLKPGQTSTDPCTIAPSSLYRGQENQLYRVEIHKGGTLHDEPTLKWSRDNGSIAAAWLGNSEDGGMIVSCARGFIGNPWVEITSNVDDLLAQPGTMVKILRVEGDVLYPESPQAWDKKVAKKVRRWDQTLRLSDGGVMPIKEGTTDADWLDLENGIQVQFQPGGTYRTGDYWQIPARAVGTIEWPGEPENPDAVTPHGIIHHYAPIWIVSIASDDGKVTIDKTKDLRRMFAAIQ